MSETLERPDIEKLRQEAAAFVKVNWDTKLRTDAAATRALVGKVADGRRAALRWKDGQFGRGLSDRDARIIEREFHAVGAPGTGQDRTNLWANTLLACGTEALQSLAAAGSFRRLALEVTPFAIAVPFAFLVLDFHSISRPSDAVRVSLILPSSTTYSRSPASPSSNRRSPRASWTSATPARNARAPSSSSVSKSGARLSTSSA